MAPPKKPAGRRQRRNHGSDVGLVLISDVPAVPAADAKWLAATRDRWEAFWCSPVAGCVERASDLPAIRRLFAFYDDFERCERAFRRERFVEGSRKQPRLNPLADHMARIEPLMRALEDRFGLSPRARLALGVQFAAAHQSLAALNEAFDDDLAGEADPRLEVIDGTAS